MAARGLICALAVAVAGVAMVAAPVAAGATCTGDASWTSVSLASGWSNSSGTWAYRRDATGFVHFGQGYPGGAYDNHLITTLPTGYRPAAAEWFVAVRGGSPYSSTSPSQVTVNTDGSIWSYGSSSNGMLIGKIDYYVGPDCTGGSGGSSGMTNPMTTPQDLIVGGASGAAGRLGVGSAGQVLTVGSGGVVGWVTAAATSVDIGSFSGDALATVGQFYSLILVIGALLVLGVGYSIAAGLRK